MSGRPTIRASAWSRLRASLVVGVCAVLLGACGYEAPRRAALSPAGEPAPGAPAAERSAAGQPTHPPAETATMASPTESASSPALATFGGGCFWCTEAVFLRLAGVLGVRSGYAGGTVPEPTYDDVCAGTTGHAEVIEVRFDPAKVSYEQLLKVFFATHDPTTPDRQGADSGTQYRSIILTHDDAQRETARRVIGALDAAAVYAAPIVTQVVAAERFWPAEAYHQDFYARNPRQGYCRAVVAPKVEKFEQAFRDLLKR